MITTDRLALLVAFDIAAGLRDLGIRAVAALAHADTTPDTWLAIHEASRILVTDGDRDYLRRAIRGASLALHNGDVESAALAMATLRDLDMTVDAYAAEIAAEAAAAGVSL